MNYELKEYGIEADVIYLVENLEYKPDTPVQRGIGEFIKWYKSYFGIQ